MAYPTAAAIYSSSGPTPAIAKNTTLLTHIAEDYQATFRQVVFDQVVGLKALGVMGFGAKALKGGKYGNVEGNPRRGVKLLDPSFQWGAPLMTSAPSGSVVGWMGNVNPTYNDPGTSFAYAPTRLYWSVMIPEEFVKDNTGKNRLLSRFETEMNLAQGAAARDINYWLCGHSSKPTNCKNAWSLPYMISVTQDSEAPGGIDPSSSTWWANQYVQCSSVGGGGYLDRPLVLLRKLSVLLIKCRVKAGSSNDQLLLATQGAYLYYKRAAYADTVAQGVAGLRNKEMYDAEIDHLVFDGSPMVYDSALAGPYGATASGREAVYALDTSEGGIAIRRDEYFQMEGWAAPLPHHKQRFYQLNIWFRGHPYVSNRRVQGVLYDIPENTDDD